MRNLVLIGLIICSGILVGCCSHTHKDTQYVKHDVKIFDANATQHVYIDKETGVQYIIFGVADQRCMSVRLGADGKPLLAEDWR